MNEYLYCVFLTLHFIIMVHTYIYDTVLDKPGQLADKKPKIQKLAIQKLFILVSTYGI